MEEIERCAEGVLAVIPRYLWDGESVPVPVEEIADSHFGLRVLEAEPEEMRAVPGCPPLSDDQSLSGLLLPTRREIWVNAEEARTSGGRRRFTICHELGHWVMHSVGRQSVFCRSSAVELPEDGDDDIPDPEEEASMFAAALLMPPELVRREYERHRDDFFGLCDRFGASGSAMGKRLHAVI
jgi:hypothetical protein